MINVGIEMFYVQEQGRKHEVGFIVSMVGMGVPGGQKIFNIF